MRSMLPWLSPRVAGRRIVVADRPGGVARLVPSRLVPLAPSWLVPLAPCLLVLLAACSRGEDRPASDEPAPVEASGGSGESERASTGDETGDEPGASGDTPANEDPAATAAAAAAASPEQGADLPEPPRLELIMARIGFDDPEALQLAEFVPVPPGATGEAGVFGRGDVQVRVALMRYSNDRFAGPHVRDIHERRRVLPSAGEAVANAGRFVIHVVAADRETADSVAESLREALRWPPPAP